MCVCVCGVCMMHGMYMHVCVCGVCMMYVYGIGMCVCVCGAWCGM